MPDLTSTSPNRDFHAAILTLRSASTEDEISHAFRSLLRMIGSSRIEFNLAPARSMNGPHRAVEEPEDILQEIGIAVWYGCSSYRGSTAKEARGWIFKIADNLTNQAVRKSVRRQHQFWGLKWVQVFFDKELANSRAAKEMTTDGSD